MKKILVVEDDFNLAQLIKFRLENSGFQVIIAADGLEMFRALRSGKPDLIVLDVMLPKIDGFKLCGLIKNYEPYKEIPIIIFTARSGEESKEIALKIGADAYITKPFDAKVLLDKINELLPKDTAPTSG
ncbi:MAG: response regulator [candidate division WOR-3 bacterium]|nr:response regulator [candidate division WOR-3 bacterium]